MNNRALELLKQSEGCRLTAYKDSVGVYTIGYGATYYSNYQKVKEGDVISQEEADRLLLFHIEEFDKAVKRLLSDVCLPSQCIDALVVLVFNIGITAFAKSTLYKKIKEDKNNLDVIEKEWLRWCYANKTKLKGLEIRRQKEFELYKQGILSQYTKTEIYDKFHKCNLK